MLVNYNGVILPEDKALTLQYIEEAVFTEDGVDYLYTHHYLRIEVLVAFATMGAYGKSPGAILANIRGRLATPRQSLTITDDQGNVIIQSPPTGAVIDDKDGPRVLRATVKAVHGLAMVVEFEVETHLRSCESLGAAAPAILSNRWETTITYNQDYMAERNISGKLIMSPRAAGADGKTNVPDSYRSTVWPSLPSYFTREQIVYTETTDGRMLVYQFKDKEHWALPPAGATTAQGTYRESSDNGSIITAIASVKLTGPRSTSKALLLCKAISIAVAYCGKDGQIPAGWLRGAEFGTEMFDNEIEVTLTVQKLVNCGDCSGDTFGIGDIKVFNIPTTETTATAPGALQLAKNFHAWIHHSCDSAAVPTPSYQSTGTVTTPTPSLTDCLKKGGGQTDTYDTQYDIDVKYYRISGSYFLPGLDAAIAIGNKISSIIGGDPAAGELIQTMTSVTFKIVKWTAERIGEKPDIPDPNIGGNMQLLSAQVTPAAPVCGFGTKAYRASGVYIYVLTKGKLDSLTTGKQPCDTDTITVYSTSDFSKTLLGSDGSTAPAGTGM